MLRRSPPRATFRGVARCAFRKISCSQLTLFKTFGNNFESDGRLKGTPDIHTVNCNSQDNTCQVKVPAPSFALVFFSDIALMAASSATLTFPTTAVTRTRNTVYIDPSLLANSNGDYGFQNKKGATSLTSDANPPRQGLSGSIAHAFIVSVLIQFLIHLLVT